MKKTMTFSFLAFLMGISCQFSNAQNAVEVRDVIIDLELNEVIGYYKKKKKAGKVETGRPGKYYTDGFKRGSHFHSSYIESKIKEAFGKRDVPVEGYGNVFQELREEKEADLAFAFKIKGLLFNYWGTRVENFLLNMDVQVLILDISNDKLVYDDMLALTYFEEADVEEFGASFQQLNFTNFFVHSYGALVDSLLNRNKIHDLIHKAPSVQPTDFDSTITVSNTGGTTSFSDARNATVTVASNSGHGSGFFISDDGVILTCNHVLQSKNKAKIILSNGIKTQAKVIRRNKEYDVALLKVDSLTTTALSLEPEKAELNQEVWVIGTPFSKELAQSLTKGIVSSFRAEENKEYIQMDASVSPGNSGGPLLDENGKVRGIVNAKVVFAGTEGIGFAIPVQQALRELNIEIR